MAADGIRSDGFEFVQYTPHVTATVVLLLDVESLALAPQPTPNAPYVVE